MFKYKKYAICLSLALIFSQGCSSTMGGSDIEVRTSSFDNSSEISSSSKIVYENADFASIGVFNVSYFWTSRVPEYVQIWAEVPSKIVSIKSSRGLQFNIDGEIIKLDSQDILTDFKETKTLYNNYTSSRKPFLVDIEFLRKISKAESVKVKLLTSDGYREGDFKVDKMMSIYGEANKFIGKVESINP